jgi:acyl-CoA thioester hydrolase
MEERRVKLRIPFCDVDMHGHVHNGVYLSYVETAINEFLRESGLRRHFQPDSEDHVYHVRKVEVVYNRPIGFDDVVEVRASVARVGTTSVTFAGRIDRDGESEPSAVAEVVWVCVNPETGRTSPVPDELRAAIAAVAGSG